MPTRNGPPISDLKLIYSYDPVLREIVTEIALTPAGDFALVSGIDRLVQNVTRFLYTRLGSVVFSPGFGSPLYELIGRPGTSDDAIVGAIEDTEAAFLASQELAAAQGYLSLDEQLKQFTGVDVTANPSTPGARTIQLTVVSTAGATRPLTLPLSA